MSIVVLDERETKKKSSMFVRLTSCLCARLCKCLLTVNMTLHYLSAIELLKFVPLSLQKFITIKGFSCLLLDFRNSTRDRSLFSLWFRRASAVLFSRNCLMKFCYFSFRFAFRAWRVERETLWLLITSWKLFDTFNVLLTREGFELLQCFSFLIVKSKKAFASCEHVCNAQS